MPWNDLATAFAPVKPAEIAAVPRIGGGAGRSTLTGTGGSDRLEPAPSTPNFSPRVFKTADEALAAGRTAEEIAAPAREVARRPRISRAGIRNFASDFGAGVASAPAGASAISAFGHGLFGAIANEDNRTQAERTAALDAEKRAIEAEDRQREIAKESREETRAVAEDRRAQQELDAKLKSGYFDKDNKPLVDADGKLTVDGHKYVIDKVADEAKSLRQFYDESAGVGTKSAERVDALIAEKLTAYRQDVTAAITGGRDPKSVPTPTAEAAAEANAAPPAETVSPPNATPVPSIPRLKKAGPAPGGEATPAPAPPAAETPAATPAPAGGPPQAAIDHLKANPGLAGAFDQKYGPGSAAAVLGQ